ncbi:MAG TPA: helix-turn-helix transcriptional regulator [Gemmatimonadaceae bacterium]|nr:helix-turn-helix transcriptional regulator [Gemmatimonadaceae bacterium]
MPGTAVLSDPRIEPEDITPFTAAPASLIMVPPPDDLAPYVEYVWQLLLTPDPSADARWRVVADGYVDLSVRIPLDCEPIRAVFTSPSSMAARHDALDALASSPAVVCGAASSARAVAMDRPLLLTGARFRLGAAARVLRDSPAGVVDGAFALGDVLDRRTTDDVSRARTDEAARRARGCTGDFEVDEASARTALRILARETVHAAVRRLVARAESQHRSGIAPDARVRGALALLDRGAGDIAADDDGGLQVSHVCRELGVSRRTLERLFADQVGFAPRTYQRLRRVGAVAEELERARHNDVAVQIPGRIAPRANTLSDIAHRVGYTDHAHMTREFGRVMGVTPSAYRLEVRDTPVARHIGQVAFDRTTPVGTVGRQSAA